MDVDLSQMTARLRIEHQSVADFGTLANALSGGSSVPATVRFDVRWSGLKQFSDVHDTTNRFGGTYLVDDATAEWTASESGFRFVSGPARTSTTVFAQIGFEHNGVFFS